MGTCNPLIAVLVLVMDDPYHLALHDANPVNQSTMKQTRALLRLGSLCRALSNAL